MLKQYVESGCVGAEKATVQASIGACNNENNFVSQKNKVSYVTDMTKLPLEVGKSFVLDL